MLVAIVAVSSPGLYQATWLPHGDALLLGLAVAVLGPIGDLFESLVKRDAGVKDAGTMFGAHGGALDRARRDHVHDRRRLLHLDPRRDPLSLAVAGRCARRLVILGSTGSIGVQALDVVARSAASSRSSGSAPAATGSS